MNQQTFKLTSGNEFIPLDKLLKVMNLVGSGGEAHLIIQDGLVTVNGATEMQKRKKMRAGDVAVFQDQQITVIS
jgi:ribosome-associated protein